MRIVVSGTHASGKSTLIADFSLRHPEFVVLHDPFELVEESSDTGDARLFTSQLRVAADRLLDEEHGDDVIAERGPLDFLAYLLAVAELRGTILDRELYARAVDRTAAALRTIDLLVVLPLTANDGIDVGPDEHLELRAAMNHVLLELVDDPDIVPVDLTVMEITGDPDARRAALETLAGVSPR